MNYLWIPAGLAVALWAPRRPFGVLFTFIGMLGFGWIIRSLFNGTMSLMMQALVLAFVPVCLALLARKWQRPLMPLLIAAPCYVCLATVPGIGQAGRAAGFVILGLVGVLAIVGTWRVRWGLRIACAVVGARLLLLGMPWETNRWAYLATVVVLFAASGLTAGGVELKPPELRTMLRGVAATAAAVFSAVMALPWFAPDLPAPVNEAHAARLTRLKAKAPAGGLLWSLPTEAFTFEGNHSFPWFENLDALYLSGRMVAVVRVPGTSPMMGAFSLHDAVADLRMKKDEAELAALRTAAQATVNALKETLPLYRAGVTEREIADSISRRQKAHGAEGDSFPLIVATGPRAAKIHEMWLSGTLEAGHLVVTDIGGYKDHYSSDFTRTIPVGGKFDERTRKLYAAVYASQQAALKACKPGAVMWGKAEDGSPGLDKVSRDALEAAGVNPKYPHGLGHTVGLYVHDVQDRRPLEPGMVLTLEPGHYVPGELGIRIEDTYVVTETGCESLTTGFPADPDSVEALMAEALKARAEPGPN